MREILWLQIQLERPQEVRMWGQASQFPVPSLSLEVPVESPTQSAHVLQTPGARCSLFTQIASRSWLLGSRDVEKVLIFRKINTP